MSHSTSSTMRPARAAVPRPLAEFPVRDQDRRIELYDEGAGRLFGRMVKRLQPPAGVAVEQSVLRGDPGREVLANALRGADLIAVDAQRRTRGELPLLGSVVAKAIRGARCAVLVTPPPRPRPASGRSRPRRGSVRGRSSPSAVAPGRPS